MDPVTLETPDNVSPPEPVEADEPSSHDKLLEDINEVLKIYYSIFLITTGTVLNILSILTLSRKSFRRSTTSVYLRFLAAIDLFVLYNGVGRHFISGAFHYNVRHISEAFCKFNQWTTAFGPDISAWILVAVTAERVLSIVKPHSVRVVCTKFTARIAVLGIVLALMAANLPLLLFYGDSQVQDSITNRTRTVKCTVVRAASFLDQVWYWLDLAKFVLIPSALLTSFNVIIVSAIARSRRNVRRVPSHRSAAAAFSSTAGPGRMPAAEDENSEQAAGRTGLTPTVNAGAGNDVSADPISHVSSDDSAVGEDDGKSKGQHLVRARFAKGPGIVNRTPAKASIPTPLRKSEAESNSRVAGGSRESSLTITLVVVNATFVVCNTPVMVFLLNRDGWFRPDQGAAASLTWTVVVLAMYTNNALNFLLYCATGSRFRAEMRRMFAPCCRALSSRAKRTGQQGAGFRDAHHSSDVSDVSSSVTTSVSTVQGLVQSMRSSPQPLH